jgi:hypothetical protein
MDATAFVQELDTFKAGRLYPIVGAGQTSILSGAPGDTKKMLQVALANEISVSEVDVKIAFDRQAGDEAGHFQLVADRLAALGLDVASFQPPGSNPLFDYLRGLSTTVERLAAGLFTLESIAYGVNENFMTFCDQQGDAQTVRIYREYIQPDEQRHQQLGRQLLAKYATESALQQKAKGAVGRVLEIATAARAQAAEKMGTACFPGC